MAKKEDWRSQKEAAQIIGITYQSLRRAVQAGRIAGKREGGRRMFHIDEIGQYMITAAPGPGRTRLKRLDDE